MKIPSFKRLSGDTECRLKETHMGRKAAYQPVTDRQIQEKPDRHAYDGSKESKGIESAKHRSSLNVDGKESHTSTRNHDLNLNTTDYTHQHKQRIS